MLAHRRYPIRRHTAHLNVQYFVKEHFENDYQGSLARLEKSVEEEYIAVMKQNCYRERNYRECSDLVRRRDQRPADI